MNASDYVKQVQDETLDGAFVELWKDKAWYVKLLADESKLNHIKSNFWIKEYIHDKMQ